jgi:hypothetical protein
VNVIEADQQQWGLPDAHGQAPLVARSGTTL